MVAVAARASSAPPSQENADPAAIEIIEDRGGSRRKHGSVARYQKGRFLGKGGFAKVYEVQDLETKEVFAAKIVAKASISKPRAHAKLRSEIAIHRSLDHDKVVKFYDYFEDSENVYIILEICPNQTLNEFMRKRSSRRLSEAEAMFYIYDLILALRYLHGNRVIHRDLKLGNLFLDAEGRIKVGDFGLAAQLEYRGELRRTVCGTPNYIAPEILEAKYGHSFEVDTWSLGVILYTMVFGKPPFETTDVKATYKKIRLNQYTFPDNIRASDQVKDLIQSILQLDPRCRPSLDDILASAWFQSCQQLPPPMPTTVSAYSNSPRPPACGGCSARGETPERKVGDYARLDSPAPRAPLRDRDSVPNQTSAMPPAPLAPHHPPLRASSAAPLPTKPPLLQGGLPPAYCSGAGTPGRCPMTGGLPGGRPPSAYRGNEENMVPSQHSNAYDPRLNPTCGNGGVPSSHGSVGGVRARPQSAQHLTAFGDTGRGPQAGVPSSPTTTSLRGVVGSVGGVQARDSPRSPMLGNHQGPIANVSGTSGANVRHASAGPPFNVPTPARAGYSIGRTAASCSPRQPANIVPIASRLGPCPSAPTALKDSQGGSARGVAPEAGGGPYAGSNFPTPAHATALRTASSGPCRSFSGAGPDSPGLYASHPSDQDGLASARVAPPSATPLSGDRRPLSARRNERSSSSPALFFDGLIGGPCTGCVGGSYQPPLTTRNCEPLESHRPPLAVSGQRSGRNTPGVPLDGSHAPSSGSRTQVPSPIPQQSQLGQLPANVMPELWVVKWVDYSCKYGVGYIMSDGSIGVYFNDSTKIVMVSGGTQFDYVTRRTQERPETRSTHTFEDYPDDMRKKVTLLRHFKNYMSNDVWDRRDGAVLGQSLLPPSQHTQLLSYEPGQAPYVKKWTRNRHAFMFQLSNKIVQVIFFDKTEAVLSSRTHTVTYVDKLGQVNSYPLSNVLDVPNHELAKRLRYIKDILVNLLGNRPDLACVH